MQEINYDDIKQRWDIGKVQIRVFCLQYSSYSKRTLKTRIQDLENEISDIEDKMMARSGLLFQRENFVDCSFREKTSVKFFIV